MNHRTFGIGTLSLPLALIGILWGFKLFDVCIGDIILNFLHLKSWTNGDTGIHLTVYYSLTFFVPAFLLGMKYKNDFGAKTGKIVALAIGLVLILSTFFLAV